MAEVQVEATPLDVTKEAEQIANATVCLTLDITKFGVSRKIKDASVTVGRKRLTDDELDDIGADRKMLRLSKNIIDSDALKKCGRIGGRARTYARSMALRASSMLKSGIYLVPVTDLEEIDKQLQEMRTEWMEAAERFFKVYPALKAEAEQTLKSLYDPNDYPDITDLREEFSFSWSIGVMAVPQNLQSVSKALWERERAKAEQKWAKVADEVREALRSSFASLIEHIVKQLGDDEEGKPRVFKQPAIDKIETFLATFSKTNLTDDAQLAALIERTRAVMRGVGDAKTIREDPEMRAKIRAQFEKIKAPLEGMVTKRTRRMKFDEEDEYAEA